MTIGRYHVGLYRLFHLVGGVGDRFQVIKKLFYSFSGKHDLLNTKPKDKQCAKVAFNI